MFDKRDILILFAILTAFILSVAAIVVYAPRNLPYSYTTSVEVIGCENVECAVSNVVNDITRRDFILLEFNIMRRVGKRYEISGKGIEKAKILNMD